MKRAHYVKKVIVFVVSPVIFVILYSGCGPLNVYTPCGAPLVTAMNDTLVNVNDSLTLTATSTDSSKIDHYIWALDGEHYSDSTLTGEIRTSFPDSGRHVVFIKVIDKYGTVSEPDSCVVRVRLDPPFVTPRADTSVSQNAKVTIVVKASDTNAGGTIETYYWNIGSKDWTDSTTDSVRDFTNPSGGPLAIVWAARDDDGVMSAADTFFIIFNHSPSGVTVSEYAWKSFDFTTSKGDLCVSMNAIDPDSIADAFTYSLSLGSSAGNLSPAYHGKEPLYVATGIFSLDTLHWQCTVSDLFGDSAQSSGIIIAPPNPPRGMRLIHSKDSSFQMGNDYSPDALPIHTVTITCDYWIDTTEVTQESYKALMGINPSSFTGNDYRPVEKVTWFDAVIYCNKRSRRDSLDTVYSYTTVTKSGVTCIGLTDLTTDLLKKGYRLPTEAEWEFACRAGTISDYYWGDKDSSAGDFAWFYQNSETQTHQVALKEPNAFGLYDMAGNVYEWCNDWYEKWSTPAAKTDPTGMISGTEHSIRGGSWNDGAENLLSGYRVRDVPTYRTLGDVGFRCVRLH